jgi:hypothetical protein
MADEAVMGRDLPRSPSEEKDDKEELDLLSVPPE